MAESAKQTYVPTQQERFAAACAAATGIYNHSLTSLDTAKAAKLGHEIVDQVAKLMELPDAAPVPAIEPPKA
jgi:hypothetical protein